MYKQCRILNKVDNTIYHGQLDTNFEGKEFYDLVEIPDDNRLYKWDELNKTFVQFDAPLSDQIIKLYSAHNAYIQFCRDNELPDIASASDAANKALIIEQEAMSLIASGDTLKGMTKFSEAIKLPLLLQGHLDNILAAGGNWNDIEYHLEILDL